MSDGGYEEKASPAKAGGKASSSKQPKPKPNPIRARIIRLDDWGDRRHMIIASGFEQGIEQGMKAKFEGDGLVNPNIDMVYGVQGRTCEAVTTELIDHIQQDDGKGHAVPRYVEIGPDKVPDR